MPLRYIGNIITTARKDTGETDFSADNGVPNSIPLQAAREAVIHCQNSLIDIAPRAFETLTELDPVVGQTTYELPENTYIGSSIAFVQYSKDGSNENYYMLSPKDYAYFAGGVSSEPCRYAPYGERSILVDPALDAAVGKLRVSHGVYVDQPALRSGKIASIVPSGSGYTSAVLENDANLDETELATDEYLCVNSPAGDVEYYNAFYSYNSTTKTLTFTGALSSVGSMSVGDYVTVGKYTTTHPKLSRLAEPIIVSYIRRRFYLGKSSEDVEAENENIRIFTEEMQNAYKKQVRGQKKVPYTGKFENIF